MFAPTASSFSFSSKPGCSQSRVLQQQYSLASPMAARSRMTTTPVTVNNVNRTIPRLSITCPCSSSEWPTDIDAIGKLDMPPAGFRFDAINTTKTFNDEFIITKGKSSSKRGHRLNRVRVAVVAAAAAFAGAGRIGLARTAARGSVVASCLAPRKTMSLVAFASRAFGALLRRGTRPSTPSTEVPSTSASSPTLPILAPVPAGTALHGVATATALLGVVSHPITLLASELEEAEAEAEAELVLESSASGAVMRPSGVTSHPIQLDTADEE